MKTEPRLRPRTWMTSRPDLGAGPVLPRRWWRPLSLTFRCRRLQPRTQDTTPHSVAVSHPPQSMLTRIERHLHYHMHEGARFFTQGRQPDGRVIVQSPGSDVRVTTELRNPKRLSELVARIRHEERIVNTERLVHGSHWLRPRVTERNSTWLIHEIRRRWSSTADHLIDRLPGRSITLYRDLATSGPRIFSRGSGAQELPTPEPVGISRRSRVVLEHRLAQRALHLQERPDDNLPETFARENRVPMVWRQSPPHQEGIAAPAAHSQQSAIRTAEPPASHQVAEAARVAANAVPPSSIVKFEGPAMDRLAEDVMHRIDRRIRIERERRGL